jgi:DNA polymerase III subunit delta'
MSFKDIYGHEKQIRILQSAVLRNRLAHAYLFCGMEGIGKRTVAQVFAKAINCETRKVSGKGSIAGEGAFDSCDRCLSCLKSDRNHHPDIISVKADGQFIRVKEIREIQEQMRFAPLEGGMRIFVVNDADKMNGISANALLKTLEEPSRSNMLILITSTPHQLPVTVVSRCQPVRFNPLENDTVASFLKDRFSVDGERAFSIASSSGGSIGRAVGMRDDSHLALRAEILQSILIDPEREPLKFLSMISIFGNDRENITDTFDILLSGYRDALVYKETGDDRRLINRQCTDVIKAIASGLSVKEILQNIKTVAWAMRAIDQNANKQLTLEAMLFKFIHCRE